MSTQKVKFYRTNWFWSVVALAILVLPLVAFFFVKSWEWERHRIADEKMNLAILRLSLVCPKELSENRWGFCITWTSIFHSNFGCLPSYFPTEDLNRIADELRNCPIRGACLY